MKLITLIIAFFLTALLLQPVFAQVSDDGLVAQWRFNENSGDIASDSSGNGHDGTLMGDPQWTNNGYFGGALEFDQTADEVNVPYHEDLNLETFTVTAWANVEPGSANHRAVVSSRADFPQRGYIFYAEPGNTWQFWTGITQGWNSVQGPAVNLGDWDHLAGVVADGKQKFYVNGEFVGEEDAALGINPEQEFLIGAGANETANHNYFFKGIIDDVRIYDRELTADEIGIVMAGEVTAVEAADKIAVTWGQLKAK